MCALCRTFSLKVCALPYYEKRRIREIIEGISGLSRDFNLFIFQLFLISSDAGGQSMKYGIKITDASGGEYVLCAEGTDRFQTFRTYSKADDYNYEFENTLPDGMKSEVVTL